MLFKFHLICLTPCSPRGAAGHRHDFPAGLTEGPEHFRFENTPGRVTQGSIVTPLLRCRRNSLAAYGSGFRRGACAPGYRGLTTGYLQAQNPAEEPYENSPEPPSDLPPCALDARAPGSQENPVPVPQMPPEPREARHIPGCQDKQNLRDSKDAFWKTSLRCLNAARPLRALLQDMN